jgi:hypothetical protein
MGKKFETQAAKTKDRIGRILIFLGLLCWFPLVILIRTIGDVEETPLVHIGLFLSIIVTGIGAFLIYRAKQYRALEVSDFNINAATPHVLYLRAFESDSNIEKYTSSFASSKNIGMLVTEEEQLNKALQPFGPLVAIGKPGESLPEPGAARMYVAENWKSIVETRMKTATIVIIRAGGNGDGILWEIKHAFEILPPKKIIIYVNMKRNDYRSFSKSVHQHTGILLPDKTTLFKSMKGFFRFSENRSPEFLEMKIQIIRASGFKGQVLYSQFKFALKPIFEDYKVKWDKPKISIVMLIALIFASFLVISVIRVVIKDFF